MIDTIHQWILKAIGPDTEPLTYAHIAVRSFIVYVVAIILTRISKKRFLAKPSVYDLVLLLIFGAVISRAITGGVPFFATLFSATMLMLLYNFFSYITFYSTKLGALIKGRAVVLVKDGHVQWENLRITQITERDLMAALRRNGRVTDPGQVKLAILERNGEISVVRRHTKPEVVEVKVEQGVQTVKIEIQEK